MGSLRTRIDQLERRIPPASGDWQTAIVDVRGAEGLAEADRLQSAAVAHGWRPGDPPAVILALRPEGGA